MVTCNCNGNYRKYGNCFGNKFPEMNLNYTLFLKQNIHKSHLTFNIKDYINEEQLEFNFGEK